MLTFAVPQGHDIAHAVLGMLLDRAVLRPSNLNRQGELTIALAAQDMELLKELGVFQSDSEELIDEEAEQLESTHDLSEETNCELETELVRLQQRIDRTLVRSRMAA